MKIVILTGSGISVESGISTFRSATNSMWNDHSVDDVASIDGYRRNPSAVLGFHDDLRTSMAAAEPNDAHRAIAKLQASGKHEVFLVTQNIDDLHERGGSTQVLHMHGSIFHVKCNVCLESGIPHELGVCPNCRVGSGLRPDVVWFGEEPHGMGVIQSKIGQLTKGDEFWSIGTSGIVYPAAAFVRSANNRRATTIEFNTMGTPISKRFDMFVDGPATETVTEWVDCVLGEESNEATI